ncbi:3-oxoacyl-[acyl-carrier-protein] synthase-1 [Desulfosalsimonas propionicica]|uniref:3-oxoacyl-[acyl-carrier-protein] synthase-1 n=1 Tax=Desulfosalsimonas propionicica TaxID=332175 RepID=A0A7W0HM69_9BACT|nr:beta-ketoacyl-[acyl-carrier-protein] synthase family protein [Desulfosalsimonas propionicica]MBA2883099.1 3-oxoacyl-[acyl-carrier-protein] synthase-1 [Desulfosalsimonas propionicica]
MNRRVFITGYGIITAIGSNGPENFASLRNERSGYGRLDFLQTVHRDEIYCCEIKLSDDALCRYAGVPTKAGFSRTTLLGLIAAREAIDSAGLTEAETTSAGLVSATTAGGIRELESYYYELQDPESTGDFLAFLDTGDPGEHTERMADILNMKRYLATVSTACASAANSIIFGARLIANGLADIMICGGSEALSKVTINGFNSLKILDRDLCKPFDHNRNGLNLGEGAGFLVLEAEERLGHPGKKAIAELCGYASLNDAFHQTASSPEGTGTLQAMRKALAMGGIAPEDVDYINAHGTGTENNDLSEGLSVRALFKDQVPPFSSTKPYTGHTTSAAGSVEAAFCLMGFEHDAIFPNLNFSRPMEELGIRPVTELRPGAGLRYILSNSLGFGGSTTSLLFAKC